MARLSLPASRRAPLQEETIVVDTSGPPAEYIHPLLYSPRETERLLGISHATLYRLIRAGRLDARKIGARTRITRASIERLIAALQPVGDVR